MDGELLAEQLDGGLVDLRILSPGDPVDRIEPGDLHTHPGQALPNLQTDGPEPDHRHGGRQILELEDVVGGDDAVAERLPRLGHQGSRAGRNHDGLARMR